VEEMLLESLSESISDGSLQRTVDEMNPDTPVTILSVRIPGSPTPLPANGPTNSPASAVQAEATVLFQIGLNSGEEDLEYFLSDVMTAIEELAVQEFSDSIPGNRQLQLSTSTGGT